MRRDFQLSPQTCIKYLFCARPWTRDWEEWNIVIVSKELPVWEEKQTHGIIIKIPWAEKQNRDMCKVLGAYSRGKTKSSRWSHRRLPRGSDTLWRIKNSAKSMQAGPSPPSYNSFPRIIPRRSAQQYISLGWFMRMLGNCHA